MLKRKVDEVLKKWSKEEHKALLITGARQIGKTFSINNFIDHEYEYCIKINFVETPNLIDTFCDLESAEHFLLRLSMHYGALMHPNKTVIFLDEIQLLYKRREQLNKQGILSPTSLDIISAMKSLVMNGEYKFILSGSLLGVNINNVLLTPTGYMDVVHMYPLDFEEFLLAKQVGDNVIEYVKKCFDSLEKVDEQVNKTLLSYFREYVLIGGLPEAVESYIENKNLYTVSNIQQQISNAYLYDITNYIENEHQRLRIREIYQAIPSELNSKNKRFMNTHVVDNNYLKRNDLVDEYLWLTNAAIALPVYNVTEAIVPLVLSSERKTLKLFLNDIGLLNTMLMSTNIREKLINNEKEINFGAPYENAVAQELYAHGFDQKLYYYNSKKNGEVDFLVEYNGEVLPLEVKSGKPDRMNTYNHSALNKMINNYSITRAYVLGECNIVEETNEIIQLPIYMIAFIHW